MASEVGRQELYRKGYFICQEPTPRAGEGSILTVDLDLERPCQVFCSSLFCERGPCSEQSNPGGRARPEFQLHMYSILLWGGGHP